MNTQVLAIGDIHGQIQLFKEMLNHWKEATQQLVLIGDLGDRGENPKDCFLLGKRLVEEKQAIYLKGNHEDLLLRFLADPEERYENYCLNGGMRTLESLLHTGLEAEYSPTEISMLVKSHYPELIEFLNGLPLYFEWQDYVFVHAGVDLAKSDWKKLVKEILCGFASRFILAKIKRGKRLYLVIPLRHHFMEIMKQLHCGNRIIKWALMVELFMAVYYMALFLVKSS